MKQELKQEQQTKRARRKKDKIFAMTRRLQVPMTEEQYHLLEIEAQRETEGNIALLIRKKLFWGTS